MGRRKLGQQNIRKLTRTSSNKSVAVTIPIEYIRKLKWKDRQKVVVNMKGKTIVIKDWKK